LAIDGELNETGAEKFLDDPWDIYEQLQPFLHGDKIVWQHFPAKRRNTWCHRKP
jgi:hypothetical protein